VELGDRKWDEGEVPVLKYYSLSSLLGSDRLVGCSRNRQAAATCIKRTGDVGLEEEDGTISILDRRSVVQIY
jgi:hypothetical protein